ncbi:methylated-DNA--[protein]-cysteine S-methyltransferase [Demequina zhanjiangensis]|uniref:Methylated-DNA--[protein]-cysteine S-methyltransferase n=1 Tax=Demequina zhanjiangensis TaxID=3051659 RepID=A0ABT8FZA1_9MICO|nr:methylated-DNA--[protein]-cysteine S-methyltransferase [Demequina sp. SYSU T00b26]MDN4472187.1 methylated-DNA--[protein]-cysteine S-methyltransferase [Demequina sp. SYSU T00b26]
MTDSPLHGAHVDTPWGVLRLLVTPEDGVVRAAGLDEDDRDLVRRLPSPHAARPVVEDPLDAVVGPVQAWLGGDFDALLEVPVEQPGGEFFQDVWQAMREVPAGEPVSYQELAAAAGRPRAMRAVGTACRRNAVAILVPCHRVIRAGGRLGSYGFGGVGIKASMLAFEAGTPVGRLPLVESAAHEDDAAPSRFSEQSLP